VIKFGEANGVPSSFYSRRTSLGAWCGSTEHPKILARSQMLTTVLEERPSIPPFNLLPMMRCLRYATAYSSRPSMGSDCVIKFLRVSRQSAISSATWIICNGVNSSVLRPFIRVTGDPFPSTGAYHIECTYAFRRTERLLAVAIISESCFRESVSAL
jgi:hypothetical protein